MMMIVRPIHRVSPSATDIRGPFQASPGDLDDAASIRSWIRRHAPSADFSRVREIRREGSKRVVFPSSGIRHAIVIEPAAADRDHRRPTAADRDRRRRRRMR